MPHRIRTDRPFNKLRKWVLDELIPQQKLQRVNIFCIVLIRYRREPRSGKMVEGCEKWIICHKIKDKHLWVPKRGAVGAVTKQELHQTK